MSRADSSLRLRAIERAHEPDNPGVAVQRYELIDVSDRELAQQQGDQFRATSTEGHGFGMRRRGDRVLCLDTACTAAAIVAGWV